MHPVARYLMTKSASEAEVMTGRRDERDQMEDEQTAGFKSEAEPEPEPLSDTNQKKTELSSDSLPVTDHGEAVIIRHRHRQRDWSRNGRRRRRRPNIFGWKESLPKSGSLVVRIT